MNRRILPILFAAALLAWPSQVVAQDYECDEVGDVEVRGLRFEGNDAFPNALLARGIVTEPSSRLRRWLRIWGKQRCLDRVEFDRDRLRIRQFYQQRGYYDVAVTADILPVSEGRVSVRFTIREGAPTLVDTLRVVGLSGVPGAADLIARIPLREGAPFSQLALAASQDSLTRWLRNSGYPAVEVYRETATDTARRTATVTLTVDPGTRAHIAEIDITVRPRPATPLDPGAPQQIPERTVRDLIRIEEGELYNLRRLENAKRALVLTEAFASVLVQPDSSDLVLPGDSAVRVIVDVTEGYMRSARVSGGWGTLDCVRTEGEYRNNNFANRAQRFELRARFTKILIGRPLAGASGLCDSQLRRDPFSDKLNYYLGATLSDPTPLAFGARPSLTLYSERRSEFNAYLRTTPIGGVLTATRQDARRTVSASYQLEYGRTEAQPAIFCALQNLCLEADRAPLLRTRRLAVASVAVSHDWSDHPAYPTRGGVASADIRHASTAIGSDGRLQFNRVTGDISLYRSLGPPRTLALRLRGGAVVGPSFTGTSQFIPAQERLFAGGNSTVRGFHQNDLGPRIYIARGYDTVRADGLDTPIGPNDTVYFRAQASDGALRSVPSGGSALFVANVELRMRSPFLSDLLQFNAFTDFGELWTPGAPQPRDRFSWLKVTPGLGIRVGTPIGPIRVDVAYNPYSPRAGAAFFDTPVALGGQLFCVSPDNTLPVTGIGSSGSPPVQASGSCVATFQPAERRNWFRKLTFSLGIGQAF
jgi:outer membrane protein insertion porin family/translocation and assembly module TamA